MATNDNATAASNAKPRRNVTPPTFDVTKPPTTLFSPTVSVFCSQRLSTASATARRLPAIAAPPAVAQPQAHEMALAPGFGVIDELCSGVTGGAIVDVLDLARREIELDAQLGLVEHRLHGGQGGGGLVVDAL